MDTYTPELQALEIIELGAASRLTRGLWFGDYFDGLLMPFYSYKLLPS